MPSDWSRSWEVDRLVAGQLSFDGEVALTSMPRLQDRLQVANGGAQVVQARLSFGKEHGANVARVRVAAEVPLRCERCMGLISWPVKTAATLALVADMSSADAAPAGLEPVLAEHGRVVLRDLVEEELLLALPLIARHDDAADCAAGSVAADEITQQPFAQLKDLLKQR
jgi:uncharacterized protein